MKPSLVLPPRRRFPSRARLILSVVTVALAAFAPPAPLSAATFPWTAPGGGQHPRKLLLNIPDNVHAGVVRGILIHGNGYQADETGAALNAELVAFAETHGFAVLATGNWGRFPVDSSGHSDEFDDFNDQLAVFATQSGHPELVHAPWLAEGFSNGGQMAYGLNVLAPSKVIAFVANKGQYYNDTTPSVAARKTPGLIIAGEEDVTRRNTIRSLFMNNRALGALWAWVEEENIGHYAGVSYTLIRPFLEECLELRYPSGASPVGGPVALTELAETSGWLVDHDTWTDGLTAVHAHDAAPGDPFDYGWVPNQRIAYLYRAFSTYNKSAGAVSGSGIVVDAPLPQTLSFSVNMTGQSWTSIEFFEGATSLGSVAASSGNQPAVTLSATTSGYHVFHGVVTKPDDEKSATLLRPVFVNVPLPPPDEEPAPALNVLVDFGPAATTTVGSDDGNNTWNNVTSNALNGSHPLVDSTGAASGITLVLTDAFTGNQSTGTTSPGVYVEQATRDTFYFDNGKTPQLKLTGLDPARTYELSFFGSRTISDTLVRSTRFTVQGFGSAVSAVNNATNNTATRATVAGVLPTAAGEIVIDLAKNTVAPLVNDTSSGVGYLGVLEIVSEATP